MTFIKLPEIVRNPGSLIRLDTTEVAVALLVHLNSSPTTAQVLYSYKDAIGRVSYNQFFNFLAHNPPYRSHMDEVTTALKEAWASLERSELQAATPRSLWKTFSRTGALIPAGDGLFFLSRGAKRFKTISHFQMFRNGDHSGHGLFQGEKVVAFGPASLRMAEELIRSCEQCNSGGLRLPFDLILDKVIGEPSAYYYLESSGKCPNCRSDIILNTLVEPI